jgi:hypothetical protein
LEYQTDMQSMLFLSHGVYIDIIEIDEALQAYVQIMLKGCRCIA